MALDACNRLRFELPSGTGAMPTPSHGSGAQLARMALLVVLMVAVRACPLLAGPVDGLYLTWNDCWPGTGATSVQNFTCLTNSGQQPLVCGFTLAQPMDSVIAIEAVIDMQHTDVTIPDWWRMDPAGCRQGALTVSVDFSSLTACANPWGTVGTGTLQGYLIGEPRGGMNQVRMKAVVSVVPSDSARMLNAATDYVAMVLQIANTNTIGPTTCTGCTGQACLVLNSLLFKRLPGGTGDVFLQTPGAGNLNHAMWRGSAANCSAVPVQRRTWGQVKSLYR